MTDDVELKNPENLQAFITNVNGQMDIAIAALKNLFALHAGAIVAILAFMGQAINKQNGGKQIFESAYECLPWFGFGILVSFFTFLSAYFCQVNVTETWRETKVRLYKRIYHFRTLFVITLALFGIDLTLFCIGAYVAYKNMPSLIQ